MSYYTALFLKAIMVNYGPLRSSTKGKKIRKERLQFLPGIWLSLQLLGQMENSVSFFMMALRIVNL